MVENVKPFYDALISPTVVIDRHFYWSNFNITVIDVYKTMKISYVKVSDFDYIDFTGFTGRKDTLIRNMVNDKIGLHIVNCAADTVPLSYEKSLFDYI